MPAAWRPLSSGVEAAVRSIDPDPVAGLRSDADEFCEFCGSGRECIVCGRVRP